MGGGGRLQHGHEFRTSAENDSPTIIDCDRWPLGGDFANDRHLHYHVTPSPERSSNTPIQRLPPAISTGHLPVLVPVRRRRPNSGSTGGVGIRIGIIVGVDDYHQQDDDDDHLWTPERHEHRNHDEGVVGSGVGQGLHDSEPEHHRRATVAHDRMADETSSSSPAREPTAVGSRESGVGGGNGTSATRQPPVHSAELELLERRKIVVERSRTAAQPKSVKDTMSWPPVRSELWQVMPMAPLPQIPVLHPSVESGVDDKNKGISGLRSPGTARDTSDSASQAAGSTKRMGSGQRLERLCQHPSCRRGPSFSKFGEMAVFCAKHKLDGMVKAAPRKCAAPGCTKGSSFGPPDTKKPIFCFGHRLPGHVNVISPRCSEKGCHKRPSFGCGGTGNRAAYCAKHKLAGMVNVTSRICEEEGCHVIPSFAFEGERATFCWRHKKDGQRNVISSRRRSAGPDGIKAPSDGKPRARG